MIENLEDLTKVKKIENSTLKLGYNEDDYIITRKEGKNCTCDFIVPKGYERKEKFIRPKKYVKEYKFKLDEF